MLLYLCPYVGGFEYVVYEDTDLYINMNNTYYGVSKGIY